MSVWQFAGRDVNLDPLQVPWKRTVNLVQPVHL